MDTVANMLIGIKNGSSAGKTTVSFPYSKFKNEIALCLQKTGYIASINKKTHKGHPVLELELVYEGERPKVSHIERVSKQSRRVYFGVKDIHKVRNGLGILVLSTPKGILTGDEARKEQVGGEVLFKVW